MCKYDYNIFKMAHIDINILQMSNKKVFLPDCCKDVLCPKISIFPIGVDVSRTDVLRARISVFPVGVDVSRRAVHLLVYI